MTPFKHLLGIVSLLYITLNLTIGLIPLLLLALLKLLIPLAFVKDALYRMMLGVYAFAVRVDSVLLKHLLGIRFDVRGLVQGLEKDKNYLVISNHQSWADILVLQSLLIKGAPIIKFIVKKEIILIPLVGLICWAYEYPFVKRASLTSKKSRSHSNQNDLGTIDQRLADLGKHATTIINFVEGTRFNLLKSAQHDSPFQHLLKPRAGGLTHILQTFGHQIDFVLDFTIAYDSKGPVFWNLLNGTCKRITVNIQKIPIKCMLDSITHNETLDYPHVSKWLKQFWQEKDDKMAGFHREFIN